MLVDVSVLGRFHAFNLASQLHSSGALRELYTSYPRFMAERFGVPKERVASLIRYEILNRTCAHFTEPLRHALHTQILLANSYDKAVARKLLPGNDVFVGWSSTSLYSIRRAHQLGAKCALERGSCHIAFQNRILQDEYDKIGIRWAGVFPAILEKEIAEYRESDYVIVPSTFAKETFVKEGVSGRKIFINPFGVSLDEFRPGEKSDDVFRIIVSGAVTIQKGSHHLLTAFTELNLPNSELWFIGPVAKEMKPFFHRLQRSNIKTLGPFRQRELPHYYAQGSVFCLPSLQEGLAMVLVQALACGLPVICTRNSGGEDIVRDGVDGFVVRARDLDSLKERIHRLYVSKSLQKEMSSAALARRNEFAWEHYGRRTLQIYESIIRGNVCSR